MNFWEDEGKEVFNKISYLLGDILSELNLKDLERSIDRKLLFIKLVLTIKTLVKNRDLEKEIIDELTKIFSKNKVNEDTNMEHLVYDSNMYILRRIHGRKRISISEIFSKNSRTTDILDYIWLREKGYLKKTKDGRLLIDPGINNIRFENRKQRRIELDEIFKYINEIPSSLWTRIIDSNVLRKIDNAKFINMLSKIIGYNTKLDRRIINELIKRYEKGWRPSSSDWRILSKIMKKNMMLRSRYIGPQSLQWINVNRIDNCFLNKIVNDLKNLPLRERWKILSKINTIDKYEDLIKKLDPISVSSLKNPYRFSPLISNKILLGQGLVNYIKYLLTNEIQYLDYSKYILSKIRPEYLDDELKPLYTSLINGDQKTVFRMIGKKIGAEVLEFIAFNVWDFISMKGMDNDLISKALKLGYEILKYNLKGSEYKGKYKFSKIYGKIRVKKTIYNYVRGNYEIVKRYREKQLKVIAVVDISGSMLRFSMWAIMALSSILPIVKAVVLFSDKTYISKPPSCFSKPLIINYLRKIFCEGFKGYTNISLALREASRLISGNETIIVFSDLEQTVKDVDPWVEASKIIENKYCRLIIFTPPYYRSDVAEYFRKVGAEITVVENPVNIPRLLKRKLNLKIRVNIFPS